MDAIKAILNDNLIGTVATLNEDGSPWATPVHIFADDEALYWFSQPEHRHSQNIERDARVSVSLWSKTEGTKGVYVSGVATKLNSSQTEQTLNIVIEAVGGVPPVFQNTAAYRLPIGQLETSKSSENRWYFYT